MFSFNKSELKLKIVEIRKKKLLRKSLKILSNLVRGLGWWWVVKLNQKSAVLNLSDISVIH